MSKNLTKTNNTIKKVIARLCKCFACFAISLFAAFVFNTSAIEAHSITVDSISSNMSRSGNSLYVESEANLTTSTWVKIKHETGGIKNMNNSWVCYGGSSSDCSGKWGGGGTNNVGYSAGKYTIYTTLNLFRSGNSAPSGTRSESSISISIPKANSIGTIHVCSWAVSYAAFIGSSSDCTTITIADSAPPRGMKVTNAQPNWTNGTVQITLSDATESISNFSKYQYSYNNKNSWEDGSGWTKNGTTWVGVWSAQRNDTVYFRACDDKSNCSEDYPSTTVKIETSSPKLTVNTPVGGSQDGNTFYAKPGTQIVVEVRPNGTPESLESGGLVTLSFMWCSNYAGCSNATEQMTTSDYAASITVPQLATSGIAEEKYLWISKDSTKDPAGNRSVSTGGDYVTNNTSWFIFKVTVDDSQPAFELELDDKLDKGMHTTNSKNGIYYTKTASANAYIYVNLTGSNLKPLTSSICVPGYIKVTSTFSTSVSYKDENTCQIKLGSGESDTYTIKIDAGIVTNQANVGNLSFEATVIVDREAPVVTAQISDEATGFSSCTGRGTYCYQPNIYLSMTDANSIATHNVTVYLYASNSAKHVLKKVITLAPNGTAVAAFVKGDFTLGQFDLSKTYYLKYSKITDLAGNNSCETKECEVEELSELYISNSAPEGSVKYVGTSSATKNKVEDLEIKLPNGTTNVTFSDVTNRYTTIAVAAKIALIRGSVTGITNASGESYSNHIAMISPVRSNVDSGLQFSGIKKGVGYTFVAHIKIWAAWEDTAIAIPDDALYTECFLIYDTYAPLFNDRVIASDYHLITSAQSYNSTTKMYEIYFNEEKTELAGALMNPSFGYNVNTTDNDSSNGFQTYASLKSRHVEEYKYKVDNKQRGATEKILKEVKVSESTGDINIVVTGENGVSSTCILTYDTRAVAISDSIVNNHISENIYREQTGNDIKYFFITTDLAALKNEEKLTLTITNLGSSNIKEPVLKYSTGSIVCESSKASATELEFGESAYKSCSIVLTRKDFDYANVQFTIEVENTFGRTSTYTLTIHKILKSFDTFITTSAKPKFSIAGTELKKEYISADGSISGSSGLVYQMFLDYDSFLKGSKVSDMTAVVSKPSSDVWNLMKTASHLTAVAGIGTTISGEYFAETVEVSHELSGSKMLGCIIKGSGTNRTVECDSSGQLKYSLNLYYLRGNLEYTGDTSISIRNNNTILLSKFAYKNADCKESNAFCDALTAGLVPNGVTAESGSYIGITKSGSQVTFAKQTGFIEGKYDVTFSIPINAVYNIQTIPDRSTITITEEIFFYTSTLVMLPVVQESVSYKWFDMIQDPATNRYYSAITSTYNRIYFRVSSTFDDVKSISLKPGYEISFKSGSNVFTAANVFGVSSPYVYLNLTNDMSSVISDTTEFEITIPEKGILINEKVENADAITFKFKNDISPAQLPGSVHELYSGSKLKIKLEHKIYGTSNWLPLDIKGSEALAVAYQDSLRLTVAIKENSPLIVLSGSQAYGICNVNRRDLTVDKILLGGKEFTSCEQSYESGYYVLEIVYDVNRTWPKEIKDMAISNSIYDSAFNQVPYRGIQFDSIIKVLPTLNVDKFIGFDKTVDYKNPEKPEDGTITYISYDNKIFVKLAASDRTRVAYEKLIFDSTLTTYKIFFYQGSSVALKIESGVTFLADSANSRLELIFDHEGNTEIAFNAIAIEINNLFYDGAKMSTSLAKTTLEKGHKLVTAAVIDIEGIYENKYTYYFNEKSKDTFTYINKITGFDKEESYLYYMKNTVETPLETICDITLLKTYANDISFRISECKGNVNLANVGIHVVDKLGHEDDVDLNFDIFVDNTNPEIKESTQSKVEAGPYTSSELYYILQYGGDAHVYYSIKLEDISGSEFEDEAICTVSVSRDSSFLKFESCKIDVDGTSAYAKVAFKLDTNASAASLLAPKSFSITVQDRASNEATATIDAKVSAVYSNSLAETNMDYRILKGETNCPLASDGIYCNAGKKVTIKANFEQISYSSYLKIGAGGSIFQLAYEYIDESDNGKIKVEKITASSVSIDPENYVIITFNSLPTPKAPYSKLTLTGELVDVEGNEMYVTYRMELGNNIYYYGNLNQLFNSNSMYYIMSDETPKAMCVVNDENCDVAVQVLKTSAIETLREYNLVYNSIFDAKTNKEIKDDHQFGFVLEQEALGLNANLTINVQVSKRVIYLTFKKASLQSEYSESLNPILDSAYELVNGTRTVVDIDTILGQYDLSLVGQNLDIPADDVKNANVGVYELKVAPAANVTDYIFAISGYKDYSIVQKKINIDLSTVSASLKIYKSESESAEDLLGNGRYLTREYGTNLVGEKIYIVWENNTLLKNGQPIKLISNYLVFGSTDVGVDISIIMSSFSTKSTNYAVGNIPSYEATIGEITPKYIELTLSNNIRKVEDGTTTVFYRGVGNDMLVEATYGKKLQVTVPKAEFIKYASASVGIVEILPVNQGDTILTLFHINNNNNYIVTKIYGEIVYDDVAPNIKYTVTGHTTFENEIYYASSDVTIRVEVTDESAYDFAAHAGSIDIFTVGLGTGTKVFANSEITKEGSKYVITYTATTTDLYYIYVKDTGSPVMLGVAIDINKTPITLADADLSITKPEDTATVINGSQFELTINVSTLVKKIEDIGLEINPKDASGAVISDSIIGTYACDFENNFGDNTSIITCLGRFKNNAQSYPYYENGIRLFVKDYRLTNYYGVTNFTSLSAKVDSNIKVDFHTVGINELSKLELYKDGTKLTSESNIYNKFDKLVATFELSMLLEDVEKPSSVVTVVYKIDERNYPIKSASNTCEIAESKSQIICTIENISIKSNVIYTLGLVGEISYTTNSLLYTADVEYISLGSQIFEEGIIIDTTPLSVSLEFIDSYYRIEGADAKYRVVCNKNATYVDCENITVSSIAVSHGSVSVAEGGIIEWTGIKDVASPTIRLKAGAVVDYAKNQSEATETYTLNNSGIAIESIEYTDTTGAVLTSASKIGYAFTINVNVKLNRKVDLYGGIIYVSYKFGTGAVQSKEARFVTTNSNSSIRMDIVVGQGDTGELFITSVHNNGEGTLYDQTMFVAKDLLYTRGSGLTIDTSTASVSGLPVIVYESSVDKYKHGDDYYLNSSNINKASIRIDFDENLKSLEVQIKIDNTGGDSIIREFNNISGKSVTIPLSNEYFTREGRVQLSYVITMTDESGNISTNHDYIAIKTNMIIDRVAPTIRLENPTVSVNVNNLTPVSGVYTVSAGKYSVSEENVVEGTNSNSNVIIGYPTKVIGYKFTYGGNPIVKTITIPDGIYEDFAGNKSESVDVILNITEDSYTMTPYLYINGTYREAMYFIEDGDMVYYVDKYSSFYYASNSTFISNVPNFQYLNGYYTYSPESVDIDGNYRFVLTIPSDTFTINDMSNSDRVFKYKLIEDRTEVSLSVETSGDKKTLMSGDKISFVITYTNPIIFAEAPSVRLSIGGSEILIANPNKPDSEDTLVYTYQYTIGKYDNGVVNFIGFDNPAKDILHNTVNINSNNNLGIVVDNATFSATLELLETDRTNEQAKFKVVCNKEENIDCYITDPSKVKIDGANVSIDPDTHIITATNLTSRKYEIIISAGAVLDKAGKESIATTYQLDNTNIYISNVKINKANDNNEYNNKFSTNDNFIVRATLTAGVKRLSVTEIPTITYKIGSKQYTSYGEVSGNELIFIISPTSSDEGKFEIINMTTNALDLDAYNNTRLLDANSDPGFIKLYDDIMIDTISPTLETAKVIVNGVDAAVDGKYYLSAQTLSKANLEVTFSEPLDSNSVIEVYIAGYNSFITSVANNVVGSKIIISLNNIANLADGSFVVQSISYSAIDLAGNRINSSTDRIEYVNAQEDSIQIVYDNTAPEIIGISLIEGSKTTIKPGDKVVYELIASDANLTSTKSRYEYIYDYTGNYNPIIPAGHVVDYAGNLSAVTKFEHIMIYVRDENPFIQITSITYLNSDSNNVYYFGEAKPNVLELTTSDDNVLVCTLTNTGCYTLDEEQLISFSDGKLVINADAYEDDYGNTNKQMVTQYNYVDNSAEFAKSIFDDEYNKQHNVLFEGSYLVSNEVSTTYKLRFTSTREIKSVNYGELRYVSSGNYYELSYRSDTFTSNTTVTITDYSDTTITLMSIIFDNEAPIVRFDQAEYTFNSTQNIILGYNVNDVNASRDASVICAITFGSCAGDDNNMKINITKSANAHELYTLTIPEGYYVDLVGNESAEVVIRIHIESGPIFVPYVVNPLTAAYEIPVSISDGNKLTYFVRELDMTNVKFVTPTAPTYDGELASGTITGYLQYTASWSAVDNKVTIPAEIVTVNGVKNIEQIFEFIVYDGPEGATISTNLTEMTEIVHINTTHTISIIYTFDRDIIIVNGAPRLNVLIGAEEVSLNDVTVSGRTITYKYKPVTGQNGVLKIKGFESYGVGKSTIYDNAYNPLNDNNIELETKYIVDTAFIAQPTFTFTHNACIESASVTTGNITYYCNSNASSTDVVSVEISDLEAGITNNLVMKINGVVYDTFNASGTTQIPMANRLGAQKITISGKLIDVSGNETVVSHTIDNIIGIEGGYKVTMTLDPGNTIISQRTQMPKVTIKNNIGKYDKIMSDLTNPDLYTLMCDGILCSEVAGLGAITITATKSGNQVVLSLAGDIQDNFKGPNIATFNFLNMESYYVVNSNTFRFDNTTPTIGNANITDGTYYGEKVYLIDDGTSILEFTVDFNIPLYRDPIVWLGLDKNNSIDVTQYSVITQSNGVYTIRINNEGLTYVHHSNKFNKSDNEIVVSLEMTGENKVHAVETITAFSTYIDRSAPTVEFGDIADNSEHKIPLSTPEYIDVQDSLDNDSGVASISYQVCLRIDTTDCTTLIPVGGYLDLNDIPDGDKLLVVTVTDNVGNTASYDHRLFIDRTAPRIYLEELHYDTDRLTAKIAAVDNASEINKELYYCITDVNSECSTSTRILLNDYDFVEISYSFGQDIRIDYTNFKLYVYPITDVIGNVSEPFIVERIEHDNQFDGATDGMHNYLVGTNVAKEYRDILVGNNAGVNSYDIVLDDHVIIMNVVNVPEGFNVSFEPNSNVITLTVLKTVKLSDLTTMTVNARYVNPDDENTHKITMYYPITLTNLRVDIAPITEDDIETKFATPTEGTLQSDIVSSTIISEEYKQERITSITPRINLCESNAVAGSICVIRYTVVENSGWTYIVDKHIEVSEARSVVIDGVSDDRYVLNGVDYKVVYTEGSSANVEFVHDPLSNIQYVFISMSSSHGAITRTGDKYVLPLGRTSIIYGYYTDEKVLFLVSYNLFVINLTDSEATIDSDVYYKEHRVDLAKLFNDYTVYQYVANYDVLIDGEVFTFNNKSPRNYENVYFEGTELVFANAYNGIYDITITGYLNDSSNTNILAAKLLSVKFDNGIYEGSEYNTEGFNNDAPAQSKDIVITFVCDREYQNGCSYMTTNVDSNGVQVTPVYNNGVYTFTFTEDVNGVHDYVFMDDAGNTVTISKEVDNLDTAAPLYDSSSYKGCLLIDEINYCKDPVVEVEAEDRVDPLHPENTVSGIVNYQFGYVQNSEEVWLSSYTSVPRITYENLQAGSIYTLFVRIHDYAGNYADYTIIENVKVASSTILFYMDSLNLSTNAFYKPVVSSHITGDENSIIDVISIEIFINDVSYGNIYGFAEGKISYTDIGIKSDIENAKIHFVVTDELQNTYTSPIYETNIDITNPEVELLNYSDAFYYAEAANIYYIASSVVTVQEVAFIANEGIKASTVTLENIGSSIGRNITLRIIVYGSNYSNAKEEVYTINASQAIITVVVTDEAGNVSATYEMNIVVDADNPYVDNLTEMTNTLGGEISFNEPIYTNYDNIYSISSTSAVTTIVITQKSIVFRLSSIVDNTSNIYRVCLFSADELAHAAAMECQNSRYTYIAPSGSTSIYQVSQGTYMLYAIDNVGNEFTHKYIVNNVSNGIDFTVTKSSGEITGSNVTLTANIDSTNMTNSYTLKWYYKLNNQTEFVEDVQNTTSTYVVKVNGTYRLCVISSYNVTKCTNDIGSDIVINNINISDIVTPGLFPEFDPTNSVKISNGYFGNPNENGMLAYRLPAITSTLSQIAVSGTYVINSNNITKVLPTSIIMADGVCQNNPDDYCYNSQTVRHYLIDINSLGLENGDTITIQVVMTAANKTEGVYSTKDTFTYINSDNYRSASVLLSEASDRDVPLQNDGYYQHVYAKLSTLDVEFDAVGIDSVQLATFDNTPINMNDYVALTKNGYYNSLSVIIIDEFGNTKTINNIVITSIFTIDSIADDIVVSTNIANIPAGNHNKAYIKYVPYMTNQIPYIKLDLIDSYHTDVYIYADESGIIEMDSFEAGESYVLRYSESGFYLAAKDRSGNMSKISNLIKHEKFDDIPFAEYSYSLNQPGDGKDSTITLVSKTTNVDSSNYSILGYIVCEPDGSACPADIDGTNVLETDLTFVRPTVITDLNSFAGKYIKVYAKEHRGDEAVFYLHGEIDLRNVIITAPTLNAGINYKNSIYDKIIYNESQQIISIESNVNTIRYIVRDNAIEAGSNYPTINTSDTFNKAWNATTGIDDFVARDTATLDMYDDELGMYTSTLTINYPDGEYIFYILASSSDSLGNVIYSSIRVLIVTIDTRSPKVMSGGVELDENMIYNANVSGTPEIRFTANEERVTGATMRYKVDNGSLSSIVSSPYVIPVSGDGDHTIYVCDLDLNGNCLNTKTYNIKVDASSPEVSLKYNETAITTTATIGYNLTIGTRTIPTFETDIVIEDTSFDYVDITIDAGTVGYKFRYDTTKGYLYRSGSRETLISIPVIDDYVAIVSSNGVLKEHSLYGTDIAETTITIDDVQYKLNRVGEEIVSITPITEYQNSICRIPLRVLISIALANNEFLIDVPYITKITLQAYDGMSQANNSLTELTKDFDFFNPVISTVNGEKLFTITNSTIRQYLSDSAYRFVYTSSTEGKSLGAVTSMLSVCTTNAVNYKELCDSSENVLHLQAQTKAEDASNALLAVLKHILRFDGYEYNDAEFKDHRSRVFLYYTGSMDAGQPHTEGLVDDIGNLVLTQLMKVGRYNFFIQYSDINNNTSYYYLPIIVEDTVDPTFSLGTSDVNKSIEIKKQGDGAEYAVYDLSSLTYNDVYYGKEGVTCEFTLTYASSPNHIFAPHNCEENMQFEHDNMVYANYDAATRKISFNYSGTYTISYTISDGGYYRNGINIKNTVNKLYTLTVIDDTAPTITELTVYEPYTVSGNTINLGVFEYKNIKQTGISLAGAINKFAISEPNQLYGSYNMSVFEYVASESKIGNSLLASNNENKLDIALSERAHFRPQALGKYKLVYKVSNSNNLPVKLIFELQVVNTEVPKFVLTDNYLTGTETVNDYLDGNTYNANIEILGNNMLLASQLADERLSYISISVVDAFSGTIYEGAIGASTDKKCTASDVGDTTNKYAASYKCVFKYTGTAEEKLVLNVNIYMKDYIRPTIPTANATTFVKDSKVTITLPACDDNANSLYGGTTSTCNIMYRLNGSTGYSKYTSKINMTLMEGTNTIEFYAVDRAGNMSDVYVYTYILDKVLPTIDIYAGNEPQLNDDDYSLWCTQVGPENCILNSPNSTYILDDKFTFVHFAITDANKDIVTLERYNGVGYEPINTETANDYIDENGNIIEGGVYRLTAKDKALNVTTTEFYIYKEVVTELGNLTINVSQTVGGTTTTTDIEYREMFLIKYDDEKLTIPYSGNQAAFDSIKMSDGVHIVGLNGETFNYIRKYNGSDVYNLSTSIRLNDPAALENMIEINGETYLILLLVDNDDGNGNVTDPDGEGNNKGSSNSGASFAWVFYVLGAVGVVGGGFLVMKLRKKVKAA